MKKLFFLLSLCVFAATACETDTDIHQDNNDNQNEQPNEPSTSEPELYLGKDNITVGCGSSMNNVSYSIENPVEGLSVVATTDVEWIHSFNYVNKGKVGFSISANESYDERVGVITVTYGEASATLTVTQSGQVRPEEVAITAPYLLGHYYGDYANEAYNYYIVLSESNYDSQNSFYAGGWKYFLDVYSSIHPTDYTNIRIPNGVYTLNTNNDGKAGTFLSYYSIYKEYNSNGTERAEREYKSGTLTVSDDLVKLEVTFTDGTDMHIVSYSGDYTILDMRSQSGSNN